MNINCSTTVTPQLENDFCNGERISSKCVISVKALTYLGLPINSTLEDIIDSLIQSLADARVRISDLEEQVANHETRITNLE